MLGIFFLVIVYVDIQLVMKVALLYVLIVLTWLMLKERA